MLPLTLGLGGDHYQIGSDAQEAGDGRVLSFCPLAELSTDSDRAFASEWIEMLVALQGVTITPDYRNAISRQVGLMAESRGRSLSDFVSGVQMREIKDALHHYTVDGPMGQLLDAEEDGLALGAFQCFEIEELMNMGERTLVPVLTYLFRRIEKRLTSAPSLIILDEAWLMLGHPVFRDKIREWLKVLRKANCAVVLATQSISDAERSGIIDVLKESCPTKICLPNGAAREPGTREFYERIGFNERQIEIVATAIPKRDYYVVSPEGRRLFDMALGPVALSFVGASGKEDLKRIRALHFEHGAAWPLQWLQQRGSPMPTRSSKPNRTLHTALAAVLMLSSALPLPAQAGGVTGQATEWTQLANNTELISLVGKSAEQVNNQITQISQLAEQIQNQLNIYKNMLQNTAQLPDHVWGQVENDLKNLQNVVNQGQGVAFSMGNADDVLKQRFQSFADMKSNLPDGASFSTTYQSWSATNRDTIAGTLKAANLTAEQFSSEESTMSQLRSMSESSDGQMKALQVGHEIAAQQVAQMQKLRGLVSQQMTMMGTWFQSEQARQDLAQARREQFFSGTERDIRGARRWSRAGEPASGRHYHPRRGRFRGRCKLYHLGRRSAAGHASLRVRHRPNEFIL